MVPTDYRLDSVVERLIERLEGARPTHTDPEAARRVFEEVAAQHLETVIAEYRSVAPENPDRHAAFLRQEVLQTALPRYHRLAVGMTAAEQRGYGFGPLAGPIGMPALFLLAVAVFWLVLRRLLGFWEIWPLVLLDATLPLWPLVAAWLYVRRYRAELEALAADMGRIQAAERSFLTEDQLNAARELEPPATARRPAPVKEVERG
jgi:hypothetical protein